MRRQLPSASTRPPPRHLPPSLPHPAPLHTQASHAHSRSPSPPLSIISIWCGQPVCVVLISSNKSVIIAVPSLLSLPPLSLSVSLFLLSSLSSSLFLPPSPAAVFPFVQRAGVLRGAHALLWRRDRLSSRLPAFSQDCVPGPQGKQRQRREAGWGAWMRVISYLRENFFKPPPNSCVSTVFFPYFSSRRRRVAQDVG